MEDEEAEPLLGGFITEVVRVGRTVRRQPPVNLTYVTRVLDTLSSADWPGAPRQLGVDEAGRQVLEFLDGHVAWEAEQPPEVSDLTSIARVAELVRQFHDLTAATDLVSTGLLSSDLVSTENPAGVVVCHNDLSPKNTVYRAVGGRLLPVAFIDWDLAAPGPRGHDVAFICWQFGDPGEHRSVAEVGRRFRTMLDAYDGDARVLTREPVIEAMLWWQRRTWEGIFAEAAAGDPAKRRLVDIGAAAAVRRTWEWVGTHRAALEAAI